MRRGLISWSRAELPENVLDRRVARVQAAMAAAKVDALAVYSDPSRSAGASWLTAFVPYWNRGILVVSKSGRPTLFTGMSNRVHGWIKRNSNLAEVKYSTDLGGDAGKFVAAAASQGVVVAVPDLGAIPGPVIDGIAKSGASVIDGTTIFSQLRSHADPSDLALLFRAASIARFALATADAHETDAGELVAAVEGQARRLGAEETYIAVAPDLAHNRALHRLEGEVKLGVRFAIRASVAYKGAWVRMTRTLARGPGDDIAAATEEFAAALSQLPDTAALAAFPSWLIEGCRTLQPLEALSGSPLADKIEALPGSVVSVQATIDTPSGPVLVGAPVLIGRNGESASVLFSPQFED